MTVSEELTALIRPQLRPVSAQMIAAQGIVVASVQVAASPRPFARSLSLENRVMAKRRKLKKGALCGDIALQGEVVGHVPSRVRGCGIGEAVRIRSVSGITLSQQALIDCPTALALRTWVDDAVKPALKSRGRVSRINVAAHYACRNRNNKKGGRISEHGKGRAIDISGFTMEDGSEITVLKGWSAKSSSRALKNIHKKACGPFGTVLGPNADRYHRDHFHFDTARYRSGAYCR
ncbi:MAG: extensin family protein [Paracoccaceae bacterium]